jgi:hypothetical protein
LEALGERLGDGLLVLNHQDPGLHGADGTAGFARVWASLSLYGLGLATGNVGLDPVPPWSCPGRDDGWSNAPLMDAPCA